MCPVSRTHTHTHTHCKHMPGNTGQVCVAPVHIMEDNSSQRDELGQSDFCPFARPKSDFCLFSAPKLSPNTFAQVAMARADHVRPIGCLSRATCRVPRGTKGTAQLSSLTEMKSHVFFVFVFFLALFHCMSPLTIGGGKETGSPEEFFRQRASENAI